MLAICSAILNGSILPVFAIFLSKMLTTLIMFSSDKVQARKDANFYALIMFIAGIVIWLSWFLQIFLFGIVGQNITNKVRLEAYAKMLKMPITWFDMTKNSPGELTTKLESDCKKLNSLTTTLVGFAIQNIVLLSASLILGFIYEWRVTLISMGLIPLILIAGTMQMHQALGFSN